MAPDPGKTSPQAPLGRYLTFKLARVHARLDAQVHRLLKREAGLSLAQWRILALIGKNSGASASELTKYSDMDKGLFSRKLKTLVQAELVETTSVRTDARITRLTLSPAGLAIYDRTMPHMLKRQDALRDRLGAKQYDAMLDSLDVLEQLAEEDI